MALEGTAADFNLHNLLTQPTIGTEDALSSPGNSNSTNLDNLQDAPALKGPEPIVAEADKTDEQKKKDLETQASAKLEEENKAKLEEEAKAKQGKDKEGEKAGEEGDVDIAPLFNLLADENGWDKFEDIPEDQRPDNSIKGLNDYFKGVVANTLDGELGKHEQVKQLYDFMENGGNFDDYKNTYFSTDTDYSKIDLSTDANQKMMIDKLYTDKFPTKDAAWREKRIKLLEDSGDLKSEAEDAKNELASVNDAKKKQLLDTQQRRAQQADIDRKAYMDGIKQTINTATEFAGLPIKPSDRPKFLDYLTRTGKDGLTQYQKEITTDKDAALKMAYVQFLKYDFSSLQRKAKTEAAKTVKDAIMSVTDTSRKLQDRGTGANVNTEDPVQAFSKFTPKFK